MNGQAGKGSDPRPVDEKKYRENFDKIDWSKKNIRVDTGKGKDVTGFSTLGTGAINNKFVNFQKSVIRKITTGKY